MVYKLYGLTEEEIKIVERKVYKELSNPNHTVSIAISKMQKVEEEKNIGIVLAYFAPAVVGLLKKISRKGTQVKKNKFTEQFLKEKIMEESKQNAGPEIGEFKSKPTIRIPIVDDPSPDTTWHWFTFGKSKAKAIVKFFDAIKKFAEE